MTPCDLCILKAACDFLDPRCRLMDSQVLAMRPDLIRRSLSVAEKKVSEKRREQLRLANQRQYANYPARVKKAQKRYRKKNMDKVLEINRNWYQRNKAEINRKRREKRLSASTEAANDGPGVGCG